MNKNYDEKEYDNKNYNENYNKTLKARMRWPIDQRLREVYEDNRKVYDIPDRVFYQLVRESMDDAIYDHRSTVNAREADEINSQHHDLGEFEQTTSGT